LSGLPEMQGIETCSRSMLLQMSHNEADSVKSAIPKGFKS